MYGAGKKSRSSLRAERRRFSAEHLERRTLLTALTINGTIGNDYISLARTGGGLIQVDVNGAFTDYNPFDFTSVVVQGVGGTDTFNILATQLPTTIIGAGTDTVDVGDSAGVQDVTSSLNITDPPAFASINLNDTGDSVARTINMTASGSQGQVLNFAPAAITYATSDYSGLTVTTGSSADFVNVFATPGGVSSITSITNSGSATDNVTVGNIAGGAQNVHSPLSVSGVAGSNLDNLVVDDGLDTVPRTVSVTSTAVTGLAPATISYPAGGLNSLDLRGGSGGNNFTVVSTPIFITSTVVGGKGNDAITVQNTASSGFLYVEGDAGLNTVTLSNAGSAQGILSGIAVVNQVGADVVTIDDSADNAGRIAAISNFQVTSFAPGAIGFGLDDMISLTLDGGAGAGNTFTVNGTPGANCVTNLNTGQGADLVNVLATSLTSTLNIQGQASADIVNVTNAGSVQGVLGTVNVENSGSFTKLTVDDSSDAVSRIVTLNAFTPAGDSAFGSITGLAPGVINYEQADTTRLCLKTSLSA